MHRRTFIRTATQGALATGVVSVLPAPAIGSASQEWRLLARWPETHPVMRDLARFAGMVETATQGDLKIAVMHRGSIPSADLLTAVADGAAEMGHAVPFLWRATIPAAAMMFYFPFGLTQREKTAWLVHAGGQDLLDRIYAEAGCKFFALGSSGPQMGGWFKAPLRSAGDLQGLRIRIGGLGATVMAAAGAVPRNISPFGGEIKAAFEAGELDAAEVQTPSADLRNGYPRYAEIYHYPTWHEPSPTFDLFVNLARWETLTEHSRQAVTLVAAVIDEQMRAATVHQEAQALEQIVANHGTRLTPFPRDVMEVLARHASEVVPAEASRDPFSQELHDSMTGFQEATSHWMTVTDRSYLSAREAGRL